MHDPRLGRFFSVDPITSKYPELTSYQFSSNRLIDGVEWEGLEVVFIDYGFTFGVGVYHSEVISLGLDFSKVKISANPDGFFPISISNVEVASFYTHSFGGGVGAILDAGVGFSFQNGSFEDTEGISVTAFVESGELFVVSGSQSFGLTDLDLNLNDGAISTTRFSFGLGAGVMGGSSVNRTKKIPAPLDL
jgi:hypothetical protein